MKYCSVCGKEAPSQTNFCSACGGACVEREAAPNMAQQPPVRQNPSGPARNPYMGASPAPQKQKKPRAKWKMILISILAVLLVVGITAAVLLFRWYTSPEQKMLRAVNAGDYDAALDILDDNKNAGDSAEVEEKLLAQTAEIKANFTSGTMSYDDACEELSALDAMEIDSVSSEVEEVQLYIDTLNESRGNFTEAEACFAAGDYANAIDYYRLVIEEDSNYDAAQTKLEESVDQFRSEALANAQELAEAGLYPEASEVLNEALEVLPGDTALTQQLKQYETDHTQQQKTDALAKAAAHAGSGDYLSAITVLKKAQESYGTDTDMTKAVKEYEDAYAKDVSAQVDAYLKEDNINAAKKLLQDAAKELPNNEVIQSRLSEISQYNTVLLDTLTPINGGFTWNDGSPEDPFGTSYSGLENYTILHDHWRGSTYSAEYKINGEYDLLNITVVPNVDCGENAVSYYQVFVDETLRYTSPQIVRKSQPQTISVDVNDATYIKIVAYIGDGGCIMLSDVTLSSAPNFVSSQEGTTTSLESLDVFNGSLPWNEGYPANTRGDTYEEAENYATLHDHWRGTTHSAEYYVNKKYDSISLNIAPASDFGETQTVTVTIYADDVAIYTSPEITQKTIMFNTGDIDLSNTTYLKIVAQVPNYGCIILSDVLLKNAE